MFGTERRGSLVYRVTVVVLGWADPKGPFQARRFMAPRFQAPTAPHPTAAVAAPPHPLPAT